MQYRISHASDAPTPERLEDLLYAIDSGALVDRDPVTGDLRISSIAAADELIEVLRKAGCELAPSQLTRLPSQCCGGCGG